MNPNTVSAECLGNSHNRCKLKNCPCSCHYWEELVSKEQDEDILDKMFGEEREREVEYPD